MNPFLQSVLTAAGLFWKAFWALSLGYAFSSLIQVLVSRKTAAKHLGSGSPKQLLTASFFGFVSSSCSFAALSATRSLFTKGASIISALAFMFASTNLAIEVAVLAYIFLGWQYSLALFIGAPVLISIQAILVKITCPSELINKAKQHAKNLHDHDHDPSDGLPKSFKAKIKTLKTWKRIGATYRGEWGMVYKELFVGFLIAGFVAELVPNSFFQSLFPTDMNIWLLVPLQALLAPVLAIMTVIGSMGNGPLAAVLASNGIVFGAIMAFLYSDFNVPPAVKINAKYYGWKFGLYIALITAISAIASGIIIHAVFAALGILPEYVKDIKELARFRIDYTFWLNIVSLIVASVLLIVGRGTENAHQH